MRFYRELLRQRDRIEPFRRAICAVVDSHDRVLELGAGLGTYSFFAADAGAGQVWAVEGDPIVHVAETVARLNGYAGRIEFSRGWIPEVKLPDRATVLIFEDFPTRLIDARTYRLLNAVFEKYLTQDARCIPGRARLYAAPVNASAGIVSALAPIGETDEVAYGVDWAATREYANNSVFHLAIPAGALTERPVVLADLSLCRLPTVEQIGGTASWVCEREVSINAIAYWFDLELIEGEVVSNAPGATPASWGQLFLPLAPDLGVQAGQRLTVGVKPERLRDGAPGWLSWWASVGGVEVRGHEFGALPASFGDLYEEATDAVPRLNEKGEIGSEVLRLVDGVRSVSEIAAELRKSRVDLSDTDALRLVINALRGKVRRPALFDLSGFSGPGEAGH